MLYFQYPRSGVGKPFMIEIESSSFQLSLLVDVMTKKHSPSVSVFHYNFYGPNQPWQSVDHIFRASLFQFCYLRLQLLSARLDAASFPFKNQKLNKIKTFAKIQFLFEFTCTCFLCSLVHCTFICPMHFCSIELDCDLDQILAEPMS